MVICVLVSATCALHLQVLRAFNTLLCNQELEHDCQQMLFCAQQQRFRELLSAHVTTMARHGFTATAVGVLASRDARVILRDPDWLAVQFEMLRAFFAPYGDAPAVVPRMSKDLKRCLPAVVPSSSSALAPSAGPAEHSKLSCVHRAMLAGPDSVLSITRLGLKQHMRTLVVAGLFANESEARQECMAHPKLLACLSLRWHLERKAAVLEAGGSKGDVLAACCDMGALGHAHSCLLLWQRSECVPAPFCEWMCGIVLLLWVWCCGLTCHA